MVTRPRGGARPTRGRRGAALTLAVALGSAGAVLGTAAPAAAAACSGTTGVTVIVDTGSSVSTQCAPGSPSSAMGALTSAGFSVVSPQRYPGTVVCRINGVPASDPCVNMPPASAYWAFYHAPRGGSWTYSQLGVASYRPAPGTVIGFAFGAGRTMSVAPPAPTPVSTPKPTTTPTRKPPTTRPPAGTPAPTRPGTTTTPRGTSGSTTGPSTNSTLATPGTPPNPGAPATSGNPTPSTSGAGTATTAGGPATSGAPRGNDPEAAGASGAGTGGSGSNTPGLLLGSALVLGLGGATVWVLARRRSRDEL